MTKFDGDESCQDKKFISQISGGGASDHLNVLENREPRYIGDRRHVGGDPGSVHPRPRHPRRGKDTRSATHHVLIPERTLVPAPSSRVRRFATCSRRKTSRRTWPPAGYSWRSTTGRPSRCPSSSQATSCPSCWYASSTCPCWSSCGEAPESAPRVDAGGNASPDSSSSS